MRVTLVDRARAGNRHSGDDSGLFSLFSRSFCPAAQFLRPLSHFCPSMCR
jgi:hypothetical protein